MKTNSEIGPFYPHLIKEFIVNFPAEFNDPMLMSIKRYMCVVFVL